MTAIAGIALLVLLHAAVLFGLLAIVLGLGGNFILWGLALATAWAGGFVHLSWTVLLVLLGLVVLGEVVESLLGLVAARGFGATRWGILGTFAGGIVGGIVGTAILPVIGSLLGAILGGFAGGFLGEYAAGRDMRRSLRAGFGGFLGRLAATAFKFALGAVLAYYTLRAGYAAV